MNRFRHWLRVRYSITACFRPIANDGMSHDRLMMIVMRVRIVDAARFAALCIGKVSAENRNKQCKSQFLHCSGPEIRLCGMVVTLLICARSQVLQQIPKKIKNLKKPAKTKARTPSRDGNSVSAIQIRSGDSTPLLPQDHQSEKRSINRRSDGSRSVIIWRPIGPWMSSLPGSRLRKKTRTWSKPDTRLIAAVVETSSPIVLRSV